MKNELEALRVARDQWMKVPFPPSSDNEALADVHDTLVLLDAEVAGFVGFILGRAVKDYSAGRSFDELEERLKEAMSRAPETRGEACAYLEYLRGLKGLLRAAYSVRNRLQGHAGEPE